MTKTARTFGTNNLATKIVDTAICVRINAFIIEPNRLDLTRTWEWTLGHTFNAFSIVQWRKIVTICCLRQKYFWRSIENRFSRKTRHFLLHSIGTELIFRAKQLNTRIFCVNIERWTTYDARKRKNEKQKCTARCPLTLSISMTEEHKNVDVKLSPFFICRIKKRTTKEVTTKSNQFH